MYIFVNDKPYYSFFYFLSYGRESNKYQSMGIAR